MDKINSTELRANLPRFLGRGKPVARLVPINCDSDDAREGLAASMLEASRRPTRPAHASTWLHQYKRLGVCLSGAA
ncbi:MAG: hypothetical protein IT494_06370 [Gammaproteobacteria bacterium]|nr:hypothetical protein [Gammaproteobacteria bacterium]